MSATLRSEDFVLSEASIKASCKCQFWKDCTWSHTEVHNISELPSGSTTWIEKIKFFKLRICNNKDRTVYCCGSNEAFPRANELKILKKPSFTISVKNVGGGSGSSGSVRNLVTCDCCIGCDT